MERKGDEVHLDTNEARGGERQFFVRRVLQISMILAVIVLALAFVLLRPSRHAESEATSAELTTSAASAAKAGEEPNAGAQMSSEIAPYAASGASPSQR